MSYMSGNELCTAVEQHLGTLGYKVFGVPGEGWDWELRSYQSKAGDCDSQGHAAAAALGDLVQRTDELLDAAEEVIACWEVGDLAGAVRWLQLCVTALRAPPGAAGRDANAEVDGDADDDAAEEVSEGWLLHGEGPTGPWTVGAYLDVADAIEAGVQKARDWIDEGHKLDLDHFGSVLAQHKFIHVLGLDQTVRIDPIPVKGA